MSQTPNPAASAGNPLKNVAVQNQDHPAFDPNRPNFPIKQAMLTYKGYRASVAYREDDGILFGTVLDLRDTVIFEAESAREVEAAFQGAVDDYLAFCKARGREPDRPYSGRFNLRLKPTLHRAAHLAAAEAEDSMNGFIIQAVQNELERRGITPE